eukprot:6921469-Prorocentrum_lima.AAC.1
MAPPDTTTRSMADAAIPPIPVEFPRDLVEGEDLSQEELNALNAEEKRAIMERILQSKERA